MAVSNISSLFFEAAKKYPGNIAIIEKEKRVTYEELARDVSVTANYLRNKGVQQNDRVLVFVPMSIDLYKTVLAIFHIGATAVFLDEWVSIKRMNVCCKIAQCKAFIGSKKIRLLGNVLSAEIRKIPVKISPSEIPDSIKDKIEFNVKLNADSTALITFTTGSTGTPKAAKRTHAFLHEQFNALIEKVDPLPTDVDMPVLPIVLLLNLATGATSVIADFNPRKPQKLKPENIIAQIKKHKVNRLTSSPFFLKELSKYIIQSKTDTSHFRKVFTGGAPVFPHEAEIYVRAFPKAAVEIVYGSTEAEPVSGINAHDLIKYKQDVLHKGLCVGKIYRRAEVKIIPVKDEPLSFSSEKELNDFALNKNETGEIIVAGHHVLREYLNNEEALKRNKIFIGEKCWHRTGDAGYLNESGELFLTGRCNMIITENGKTIFPFLYENHFQTLEGVEIGTVIKVNGKIVAVVELNDSSKKSQVAEKINRMDLKFSKVIFMKIPRDARHNSKIEYGVLKQKLRAAY